MDKYTSSDFWYTFLNSLDDYGLSAGNGELVMDAETQEQFLSYLKEKIEEGVVDGATSLPPGLYSSYCRFPEKILSKLRSLADDYLATGPDNAAAMIVACAEDDPETHVKDMMRLASKDPCANILIIDQNYRNSGSIRRNDDSLERFLTALENLYEWAKQEETTDRYQDAKAAYNQTRESPNSVYNKAKKKLQELKNNPERPEDKNERRYLIEKW